MKGTETVDAADPGELDASTCVSAQSERCMDRTPTAQRRLRGERHLTSDSLLPCEPRCSRASQEETDCGTGPPPPPQRSIAYFLIFSYSVERSIPNVAAVSLILPSCRRSVASIACFSISCRLRFVGTLHALRPSTAWPRNAKSSSVSTRPWQVTTARSIAFSSSRTLPGHS